MIFWLGAPRAAANERTNWRSGLEFDRCDCVRCHAMSDFEEDPYAGEGGTRAVMPAMCHLSNGRGDTSMAGSRRGGTGNCFDFCSRGICFGCDYNHPQLTLRVTAAGVEARPKRLAPWCQALEALKFKYQGDDKFLHATISPSAVNGRSEHGRKATSLRFGRRGVRHQTCIPGAGTSGGNEGRIVGKPRRGNRLPPQRPCRLPGGCGPSDDRRARAAVAPAPAPAPSEDTFDDEAALALVAAAEAPEAAEAPPPLATEEPPTTSCASRAAADAARAEPPNRVL